MRPMPPSVLLLACSFAAAEAATVRVATDGVNRPVTKVINLLKDMQAQLEKEQEEDEATYQKLACWCETNDKDKTKSIADAEARITDLTSTIEETAATSAKLNTEIKNLGAEVAKNAEALDKATALRQKQLAEFNAEEKDILQSIGALKSAITALSKHHTELLEEPAVINLAGMLRGKMATSPALLQKLVTPAQRSTITAFIQQPAGFQSHAPASGEIFGILRQMKETFETNVASSQEEEMANQKAYEDLKAAKEAEISAGTEQKETKEQELADTDQQHAQAKQDLEDTRNTLSADQVFLKNLKETCQSTDQEWEERQKTRTEEIQACSEALAVLSSDDAHDTFTKTFNFVQVGASHSSRRAEAAKALTAAAKKSGDPKLAAIATSVKLDAFAKVTESIDGMISDLKEEKAAEIKQKDFCVEEINNNERAQELKARDLSELEAKIADLAAQIDELAKAIAQLEAEIAEVQTQLKRAGEDRELENKDFQTTVADQRATQGLLTNALNVLKGFYDKKDKGAALVQEPAGPPPPPGFKTYKKQSGAGGVMGMLEGIIGEAKQLEADAIQAETDAQKAYEEFVKDTNASVEEKTKSITNKTEDKANAEGDKVQAESERDTAITEQQALKQQNIDLHKSCDFTLDNFDVTQAARDQEVESLQQAKASLAGASFLQK